MIETEYIILIDFDTAIKNTSHYSPPKHIYRVLCFKFPLYPATMRFIRETFIIKCDDFILATPTQTKTTLETFIGDILF